MDTGGEACEGGGLEAKEGRRGGRHARVAVQAIGDEIGEGSGINTAPRDIREVPGAGRVERRGGRVIEDRDDLPDSAGQRRFPDRAADLIADAPRLVSQGARRRSVLEGRDVIERELTECPEPTFLDVARGLEKEAIVAIGHDGHATTSAPRAAHRSTMATDSCKMAA